MNFKCLWSRSCITVLTSLVLLASACSDKVQKISGSLSAESFGSPIVGVRVVQGESVVDTAEVGANGRFTVEVPEGNDFRIEVVTQDGVFPLGVNEVGGLRAIFFDVCVPGDGFDMGHIHPVDPGDCEQDPMACDPCAFDPSLCEDPCIANPELCQPCMMGDPNCDPCVIDPNLCVDPCIANPELCQPCMMGDPNCDPCVIDPNLCIDPCIDNPELCVDPCIANPELCQDPCLLDPMLCDPCVADPELCVDPCIANPELCMDPCGGDPNCNWPGDPQCSYDDPMCWPDPGVCENPNDPHCWGDHGGVPDERIPDFGCEG